MTEISASLASNRAFDEIEAAFLESLDVSLEPRGPDSLFGLVAGLGLPPGASVVDVGCGRGRQAFELAERFGFDVLGVDPVTRNEAAAREFASQPREAGTLRFAEGECEAIPADSSSVNLVFCRESLMFADLEAAISEFKRVLRAGGRGLIYLVLTGALMNDDEADAFWKPLAPHSLRARDIDNALSAAGLVIDERVDYASEWAERRQEQEGDPGRRLLHAARLRRQPDRYIKEFGQDNYDIMLADCLWHVYRMIGKLSGYACIFTKP